MTVTTDRTCPAWCTHHETLDTVDSDGTHPQRHTRWLFTRYAPVEPETPALALYVSDVESSVTIGGPGMSLRQYDDPPKSLDPGEARELAAALIAGAEILEAARTATCPSCGKAVVPAELDHVDEDDELASGVCLSCVGAQPPAARKARRDSLTLVRS